MVKEVNDQLANGKFELIAKKNTPTEATLLPAVWQMKRKEISQQGKSRNTKQD